MCMKTKIAFFDVDGTLSVPIYNDNGEMKIGFSDEGWIAYCVKEGEESYQYCKPVQMTIRYARKLKDQGALLYVLTTSQTSFETNGKKKFLQTHCPGLFDDVISVSQDQYKLLVIQAIAEMNGVALTECELIEDTYSTLLTMLPYGIKPTHVSSLDES